MILLFVILLDGLHCSGFVGASDSDSYNRMILLFEIVSSGLRCRGFVQAIDFDSYKRMIHLSVNSYKWTTWRDFDICANDAADVDRNLRQNDSEEEQKYARTFKITTHQRLFREPFSRNFLRIFHFSKRWII